MISSVTASLTDRGLGLAQGAQRPIALVGCCAGGSVAVVIPTEVVNADSLVTLFGHGPLVELAAFLLDLGASPLVLCGTTIATPAAAGLVTRTTGSGSSPMTAAASGTPRDAYAIRVKVIRAGATLEALTASVRWSLDGGTTYQPEVPVPASGAVVLGNTGVTITFSDATDSLTLQVDDVYTCTCTAPAWDTTGLGAALTALEGVTAANLLHDGVVVVGDVSGANIATVKTSHDNLIAASKSRWFLCNARDQAATGETAAAWAAILVGASPGFTAHTANLMAVAAGFCPIDSREIGGVWRRPLSWPIAARLATTPVSEHPGRVLTGPLPGIRDEGIFHDLASSDLSILDTRRFIGAQSIQGLTGAYATDRTTAADGSDFTSIMRVRLICYAERLAIGQMANELNSDFETNSDGTIAAAEADALDDALTSFLQRELVDTKFAADVAAQMNRTDNLVTTSTLRFKVRMRPRGVAKSIVLDLGYALRVRSS